jgi:transposase
MDAHGRPIRFFMTAGPPLTDAGMRCRAKFACKPREGSQRVIDYTGAAALLGSLPAAEWGLRPPHGLKANHCRATDRGYDADWSRDALKDKGIKPCILGRKSRSKPVKYDKRHYKRRNRIEIMFGRLKDWCWIATRYDRCPKVFLSAVALAATVSF